MTGPSFNLSNLSVDDVNLILASLNELPRKVSNGLAAKIEAQLQPQFDAYNQQAKASQPPEVVVQ